jgi:biopolymer transport protein ExbD
MLSTRLTPIRLGFFGGTGFQVGLLVPTLVLLLVAYAFTPFYCHFGKPVDLPFAPHAPLVADDEWTVPVSIQSDGNIYIDTMWYPDDKFQAKILEFSGRSRERRFAVRADRSLPFSRVRFVLQSLSQSGYRHVLLMTFEGHPLQLLGKRPA